MTLPVAFAPYVFLAILAVLVLTVSPIRSTLERVSVGLPFPATDTGFGVREQAVDAYAAFTPLTHPGTFLLLSALGGFALYARGGRYPEGTSAGGILRRAAKDALPITTAVAALLMMSKVMGHSGEIRVLALGIAAVAPDFVYLAAGNLIGMLGSLVTSSNTASSILFAPLQATAAQAQGLSVELVLAAQVAGGATGNAISPSDILLGATVVGEPSLVGPVLRLAIPWAIVTALLISIATVLLSCVV